uniref:Uncharacterized protein n=1 Tax=Mycena chlorophos TaxID=658473 RepID=A0ABQ0MCW2_MYCCL|nr:predicted protein [Mycena chlorophos]
MQAKRPASSSRRIMLGTVPDVLFAAAVAGGRRRGNRARQEWARDRLCEVMRQSLRPLAEQATKKILRGPVVLRGPDVRPASELLASDAGHPAHTAPP